MTIYEFSVISTSGFPYYNLEIKPIPENVKIHLRFFDFSKKREILYPNDLNCMGTKFDLTAGLISALYEFAKSIDKKIKSLNFSHQ